MGSVVKISARIAKRFPTQAASIITVFIFSVLVDTAPASSHAQTAEPSRKVPAANSRLPHYHVVHGWPVLPDNTILDEVSAVAVDSDENVLVLQRGGRKWPDTGPLDKSPILVPTVFVFDGPTGLLLKKWGENILALPHSIGIGPTSQVIKNADRKPYSSVSSAHEKVNESNQPLFNRPGRYRSSVLTLR